MANHGKRRSAASAHPIRKPGEPSLAPPGASGSSGVVRLDASLIRVAVVFVALYGVLMALMWTAAASLDAFQPLMMAGAKGTAGFLRLFGVQNSLEGRDIVLSSRILRIDLDCTAMPIALMYLSLVVAYPLRLRDKLSALLVGLPVVFAANAVRLVAVGILSEVLGDGAFSFAHDYLFKVFMVAVVIVLWGIYLQRARRHARA